MYPKDPAANEECSVVCTQAPSQYFGQEGANLGRAHGSPYQKSKILGFGPLFLMNPSILFYFFAIILFYFNIPVRRGDAPPPLAASL